jgi:hypothetical protein
MGARITSPTLAVATLLLSLVLAQAPAPTPVALIHGMGDFCDNPISMMRVTSFMNKNAPKSNKVFCIETGASVLSIFTSLESQIKKAC